MRAKRVGENRVFRDLQLELSRFDADALEEICDEVWKARVEEIAATDVDGDRQLGAGRYVVRTRAADKRTSVIGR